jgi:uncharacterized phage protein gp47/JayE
MAASPEVVNALVIADPITPGQVDITLIGGPPTFAVSAGAITAVQNYIAPRAPLGISVSVGSVTTLSVQVAAAYIVVRTAYQSTIATSIQQSLNAYGETILPQGVVELSEVAALIQSLPGVIEINPLSSLTLNGVAADLAVPANNVPSLLAPPASSFKFV